VGTDPESNREPADGRLTVVVGVLGKAHALKGEVEFLTGSDDAAYLVGRTFVTPVGTLTAAGVRRHGDRWLVRFDEVSDRTGAEGLRGVELEIPAQDRRSLPADEWWPEDLVGLTVEDFGGDVRGTVVEVVTGGAQDRLVVDGPVGRFEVPFVAALVPEVDVPGGRVVVDVPDGLI
jgi:16S rRNA processing protein RimM